MLTSSTRGLGVVELPGEGGAGGADLVEELVVLERPGAGDFLDGGLDGLLDDGAGLARACWRLFMFRDMSPTRRVAEGE